MRSLRIFVADGHPIIRRTVKRILQAQVGWNIVGQATTGQEAIEKAKTLKPDVAIVDISMPGVDGIQATLRIRDAVPDTKVLVFTAHESIHIVRRVFEAGAHGCILKTDSAAQLVKAVKSVSLGMPFMTPTVYEIVLHGFLQNRSQSQTQQTQSSLTAREMEIIKLLAQGKSNKEVASALAITVRTAEAHRAKIMLKFGVRSFAQLIQQATRRKLI
jgi:DNA-binding NarL/FixJ family response regulator